MKSPVVGDEANVDVLVVTTTEGLTTVAEMVEAVAIGG
jgi:hypothetical protein